MERQKPKGPLPHYCSNGCRPKQKTKKKPEIVIVAVCLFCNVSFSVVRGNGHLGKKPKFCSRECQLKMCDFRKRSTTFASRQNLVCVYCKAVFNGVKANQKYCSQTCRGRFHAKIIHPLNSEMNCAKCNKVFIRRSPRHVFCSRNCKRSGVYSDYRSRAKKFGVVYDSDVTLRKAIDRFGNVCNECGVAIVDEHMRVQPFIPNPDGPSLDHVIPMSAGGGHTWSNVVVVHFRCNVKRWNDYKERLNNAF